MRFDIYQHSDVAVLVRLDRVSTQLQTLIELTSIIVGEIKKMSPELQDLAAQVEANVSLEQSTVVLLQGIAQQLQEAKNDPVAVNALSARLHASAAALAAAVAANTPAATPAPAPAPVAPVAPVAPTPDAPVAPVAPTPDADPASSETVPEAPAPVDAPESGTGG